MDIRFFDSFDLYTSVGEARTNPYIIMDASSQLSAGRLLLDAVDQVVFQPKTDLMLTDDQTFAFQGKLAGNRSSVTVGNGFAISPVCTSTIDSRVQFFTPFCFYLDENIRQIRVYKFISNTTPNPNTLNIASMYEQSRIPFPANLKMRSDNIYRVSISNNQTEMYLYVNGGLVATISGALGFANTCFVEGWAINPNRLSDLFSNTEQFSFDKYKTLASTGTAQLIEVDWAAIAGGFVPELDSFVIEPYTLTGDFQNDWTNVGDVANYLCVDDPTFTSDLDVTRVETVTLLDTDLYDTGFTFDSSAVAGSIVVSHVAVMKKNDASVCRVRMVINDGLNQSESADIALSTDYNPYIQYLNLDPAGNPFTEAQVDVLKVGYKFQSDV